MEQSEYAGIVENYLDTVYRAALSFCGNVQDAEDVVQNTFLKLFLKAPAFQSEEHIRRWLLRGGGTLADVQQCDCLCGHRADLDFDGHTAGRTKKGSTAGGALR